MANFNGMRWFKCDLQMQTPADTQHWRGQKMGGQFDEQVAAAEAYIRRCYEVGLEVIAITDHNFLSKQFIPLLQNAIHKLTGEFKYPITLFPGFEFEADVGKGMHVLAIFEPGTNLDEIDHVLTECGVTPPRIKNGILSKSTKRLPEILKIVQRIDSSGKQRGLVILPHLLKDDGLFDTKNISEWIQQEEYLNLDLLAVEVPKPVEQMSEGWRRLFNAGEDCLSSWRRKRPIACVMSSDNKALTKEECPENFIGMRHTWIKASEPTIEALRQAFLDHASRIRLQDTNPADAETHPRIVKIDIKGAAFLEDQSINFSPGLNCIIGGRGSGKSSALEYLRFCLQPDYIGTVDRDFHEKLSGIHRTIESNNASLTVTYQVSPGVEDTVVLQPGAGLHQITGREVHDLSTVLNQLQVQFFSQGELTRLSKPGQKNQVLRLIDASSSTDLNALSNQEIGLRAEIEQLFSDIRQAESINLEVQRLRQELDELTRQWQARKDIQSEAQAHRLAQEALNFVEKITVLSQNNVSTVDLITQSLDTSDFSRPTSADHWPNAEWFKSSELAIGTARQQLKSEIAASTQKYLSTIRSALKENPEWPKTQQMIAEAQRLFLDACQAKGVQPSDVSKLQGIEVARAGKQVSVDSKAQQLAKLQQRTSELREKLSELHRVWENQYLVRRTACEKIQGKNTTTLVSAGYMEDSNSFESIWGRLSPRDSRTRLGKNWDELGKYIHGQFLNARLADEIASPWEVLNAWLNSPDKIPEDSLVSNFSNDVKQHLNSPDVRPIWEKVQLTRVDDLIDVELKRADGSSAGRMSGEGGKVLSEGQRNTALLSLILAEGSGPIVIDQPEDELDSNYIFSDLVRLLRGTKEKRQLILATHNANIPVNADAELIYALDAKEGKGKLRTQGGLDRATVTISVLDIMEGSEEAFKRRSEKYHF